VAADDVPETLTDLVEPGLKGKLAITSSTTGVRFVGNALQQLGPDAGEQFLEDMAAQDVRVEAVSGAALAEMIARGEVAASPGIFRDHALQHAEAGMPIEWFPLEPVTANIGYSGVFADAPNPCSAALFLDFILGDPGTEIYGSLHYSRPAEDPGFEVWVPDESFDSTDAYNQAFEEWGTKFDESFGGR
jgi:ABC-type Fe3+ transport system substrate-binding protein